MKRLMWCLGVAVLVALVVSSYPALAADFDLVPEELASSPPKRVDLSHLGKRVEVGVRVEAVELGNGMGFIRLAKLDGAEKAPQIEFLGSRVAPESEWGISEDGKLLIPIDHLVATDSTEELLDWEEEPTIETDETGGMAQVSLVRFGGGSYGGFGRSGGFSGGGRSLSRGGSGGGIARSFSRPSHGGQQFRYSAPSRGVTGGRSGYAVSGSSRPVQSYQQFAHRGGTSGRGGSGYQFPGTSGSGGTGVIPNRYGGVSYGSPLTPPMHNPPTHRPPVYVHRPQRVPGNIHQSQNVSNYSSNRSIANSFNRTSSVYAPTNYSYKQGGNFALSLPIIGGFGGGGFGGGGCAYSGGGGYSYAQAPCATGGACYDQGYIAQGQGYNQQPVAGTVVQGQSCPTCPNDAWEIDPTKGIMRNKVTGDVYAMVRFDPKNLIQPGATTPKIDVPAPPKEEKGPIIKGPNLMKETAPKLPATREIRV